MGYLFYYRYCVISSYSIYYFIRSVYFINTILKGELIMTKKIIYFLCTGNSCRSQMAEGWAKNYLDVEWHVYCDGIDALCFNKKAVRAMMEVAKDISDT